MWLGIPNFELFLAYVLTIGTVVWSVVYTLYFWKSEGKDAEVHEASDWDKEEAELERNTP